MTSWAYSGSFLSVFIKCRTVIFLTAFGECRLGLLSAGVSAGVGSPSLLFSRLLVLYSLSVILYSSVLFLCVVFFVLCCVAWRGIA